MLVRKTLTDPTEDEATITVTENNQIKLISSTSFDNSEMGFPDIRYITFGYGDDTMGGIAEFYMDEQYDIANKTKSYTFDFFDENGYMVMSNYGSETTNDHAGDTDEMNLIVPPNGFLPTYYESEYYQIKYLTPTTGTLFYEGTDDVLLRGKEWDCYVCDFFPDNCTKVAYILYLDNPTINADTYLFFPDANAFDHVTSTKQSIIDGVKSEIRSMIEPFKTATTSSDFDSLNFADCFIWFVNFRKFIFVKYY